MPKKILIITSHFYPSVGGIEEQVLLLSEEYIKRGFSVDIYTLNRFKTIQPEYESFKGINIYRFKNNLGFLKLLFKNRRAYEFIISRQYFIRSFLLGLFKSFKIINCKTLIFSDTGSDDSTEIKMIRGIFKFRLIIFIYFFFIGKNDYLNAVNKYFRSDLEKIYGKSDKIITIYNGIRLSGNNYPKRNPINNILFLATLSTEKGIFELIEAFKLMSNKGVNLKIAGSGSQEMIEKVKNEIIGFSNIEYVGQVSGKDKDEIYANSDLFVTPSYTESFGMTIFEAASYNLPIITTINGDIKDIYSDNLIYINKKDVIDLKNKLEWTIKNISSYEYDYSGILLKFEIGKICNELISLI